MYVKFEDIPQINFLVMTNFAQFSFPYAVITITYIFITNTTIFIVSLAICLNKFSARFIHYRIILLMWRFYEHISKDIVKNSSHNEIIVSAIKSLTCKRVFKAEKDRETKKHTIKHTLNKVCKQLPVTINATRTDTCVRHYIFLFLNFQK